MYVADHPPTLARRPVPFAGALRVSSNVWNLGLTSLVTDVSSEMVTSVLPAYLVLHLGLSPLGFGAIDGLYQGIGNLVRWVAGSTADRWHRHKEVAATGYALSALCKIGLLLAGGVWTAIATVVAIDRIGKGGRTAPRDALISLSSDPRTLGLSFGLHRTLDAIGAFLGPIVALGVLAIRPRSFDSVFVVSFSIAIVGLAIILLFVENVPSASVVNNEQQPTHKPFALSELFRIQAFRTTMIGASVLSLTTVSDGFIFLTLQRSSRFGLELFPVLALATAGSYFLFAMPAGRLSDYLGRRLVFIAGHVGLLAIYLVLWLQGGSGAAAIGSCVLVLGMYYAMTDGVLAAAVSTTVDPELRGTGLASAGIVVSLFRALAALLFGWLWTVFGVATALACFSAGLFCAVLSSIWMFSRLEGELA